MNILIVDDNQNKREYIKHQISKMDENAYIRWVDNYQDAASFIEDNQVFIDLIILDWCFPPNSLSRAKYGMGRHLLSYLLYNDINIDVVICTSDSVTIDPEEYPFVKTIIHYDNDHLNMNFGNIVDINEEQEDVKTKVLSHKELKVKNDTGYKRRKSSQPWWMK